MNRTYRFASSVTLVLFFLLLSALPGTAAEGKRAVNINSADASQLALLPRIGPSVAQRILEFRKQNGPFKSAEDLMLVRGIGEKTFALIKPYVAVSGETTLKEKVKGAKPSSSKEGGKDSKEGSR
ncbi:MAG TPA: helix-hairpin-helix domain-containing protein [Thermoanaerobaculia bacterium]|nr:helix-hairpin-helix domain-containing protein [Thermoanaerobaculia bacterium]